MQVIGKDKQGNLIGVEKGLLASTMYRRRRRTRMLAGLGEPYSIAGSTLDVLQGSGGGGGGFDWESLWTGLNPVLQGVGASISGGNPYPIPQGGNPYLLQQPVQPGASAGFSLSPMLLIGALGLGAILLLK